VKRIDSDALGIVTKALGIEGKGSSETELLDGQVDQVLEVGNLARRGRTLAQTEGLFLARLRNAHAGASDESTTVNIYGITSGVEIAPYPAPMPAQFDIWVLSATLRRTTGSGTITGVLFANYPAQVMGISSQEGGPVGAGITSNALAVWDSIITSNLIDVGVLNEGGTLAKIGIRMPRAPTTQLVFQSESSAVATYDCLVMLGVFPVGLGQDGIV
jgi:hypothetical protein